MASWVLEIRSGWLENESLEISDYTVFAGFNASMKSSIIRTIYGLLASDEREASRLVKRPEDRVCIKLYGRGERCFSNMQLSGELKGDIIAELVPDYRLFLREALALSELFDELETLGEEINGLCIDYLELIETGNRREEKEAAEALCNRVSSMFSNDLKELKQRSFFLINKLRGYKATASELVLKDLLHVQEKVVEEAVKMLKTYIDSQEEVKEGDLVPFVIEVTRSEQYPLRVYDSRLGYREEIPLDKVSSSISSYITLSLVANILAQPADVILVAIEEPEEGLAPPQQYLFSLLLAKYQQIASRYRRDVKILATTHSPYIAHAALVAHAKIYYVRYNWETRRFRVEEKPYAIFTKADRLALRGIKIDDKEHKRVNEE